MGTGDISELWCGGYARLFQLRYFGQDRMMRGDVYLNSASTHIST